MFVWDTFCNHSAVLLTPLSSTSKSRCQFWAGAKNYKTGTTKKCVFSLCISSSNRPTKNAKVSSKLLGFRVPCRFHISFRFLSQLDPWACRDTLADPFSEIFSGGELDTELSECSARSPERSASESAVQRWEWARQRCARARGSPIHLRAAPEGPREARSSARAPGSRVRGPDRQTRRSEECTQEPGSAAPRPGGQVREQFMKTCRFSWYFHGLFSFYSQYYTNRMCSNTIHNHIEFCSCILYTPAFLDTLKDSGMFVVWMYASWHTYMVYAGITSCWSRKHSWRSWRRFWRLSRRRCCRRTRGTRPQRPSITNWRKKTTSGWIPSAQCLRMALNFFFERLYFSWKKLRFIW